MIVLAGEAVAVVQRRIAEEGLQPLVVVVQHRIAEEVGVTAGEGAEPILAVVVTAGEEVEPRVAEEAGGEALTGEVT